jgi:excisionase family DNA binding protein
MSSSITVRRICEHCKYEFSAKTTVTKYCSNKCASKAYKARLRATKVIQSNIQTEALRNRPIEEIKAKDYLSINEACKLIGLSRRTIYRLIDQGHIIKHKVGTRSLLNRAALDKYIIGTASPLHKADKPINESDTIGHNNSLEISECLSLDEVMEIYGISESALHQLIRRKQIPRMRKGKKAYIPKNIIESILG